MRAVRGEALAAAALGALGPGIVGAVNGGYFETAWGWIALVLLWVAGLAVALRSGPQLTRPELALLMALAGLLAWVFASLLWAPSADEPIREAERLLVYVSVILAAPLIVRKGRESWLLGGVLAGVAAVCTYALAARLIPEAGIDEARAGERLAEPLGYWNALGIFAVLGILVAAGVVGRGRSWWSRGLAGASLVVLSATVYFTFSRGAWLALAVGLIAMLAFDPRRLQTGVAIFVAGIAPAAGVWLSAQSPLTDGGGEPSATTADGRGLAFGLLMLAGLAAASAVAVAPLAARVQSSRRVRRASAVALATTVGLLGIGAFAIGNPVQSARDAYNEFRAPPPPPTQDLDARLFTFSSSWRYQHWQVAWEQFLEDPVRGSGAGTYEAQWLRERPSAFKVRDAHSLYFETLAELGFIGLALLLAALAIPVAAAARVRQPPTGPRRPRCVRGLPCSRGCRLGLGDARRHVDGLAVRRRDPRRR